MKNYIFDEALLQIGEFVNELSFLWQTNSMNNSCETITFIKSNYLYILR